MPERFTIADLHLGQDNINHFTGWNGGKLRPFENAEEMDAALIERWNAVVPAQGAKVDVLGDVVMKLKDLHKVGALNGKKRLIKGNHDILKLKDYIKYFYDISAYKVTNDLVMSHIPIHEESLKQRWIANVHGHLHDGRVMKKELYDYSEPVQCDSGFTTSYSKVVNELDVINPRYLCVSVEHTDFAPISMDEVYARIREQQS